MRALVGQQPEFVSAILVGALLGFAGDAIACRSSMVHAPLPTLERALNPLPNEITFIGKIVGYGVVGHKVEVVRRIQGDVADLVTVFSLCRTMGQVGDVLPFVGNSFSIREAQL